MIELTIAPIIILLLYIYIRDRYEKEPYELLVVGVIMGAIITPVIIFIEEFLISNNFFYSMLGESLYISFIVAGLTEELVKFVIIYALISKTKEFNEPFDGIVYSSFVALGFAMVENFMYVFSTNMITTAIARSITAVPIHMMYGIIMGYYLGMRKIKDSKSEKNRLFVKAILYPVLYHGIYDFSLIYPPLSSTLLFAVVIVFTSILSYKMMKDSLKKSPFRRRYYYKNFLRIKNSFEEDMK